VENKSWYLIKHWSGFMRRNWSKAWSTLVSICCLWNSNHCSGIISFVHVILKKSTLTFLLTRILSSGCILLISKQGCARWAKGAGIWSTYIYWIPSFETDKCSVHRGGEQNEGNAKELRNIMYLCWLHWKNFSWHHWLFFFHMSAICSAHVSALMIF
jgi:hypothetical protein